MLKYNVRNGYLKKLCNSSDVAHACVNSVQPLAGYGLLAFGTRHLHPAQNSSPCYTIAQALFLNEGA